MTLLVQISDTHFGTESVPVVEALVRMVAALAPSLVVLSGDVTQRARPSQFRAARAFVDRLGAPATLVIPGNHDIALFNLASRLFRPYANHRRAFGHDLEPSFESDALLVVSVNTTRPYLHERGVVSPAQVERVARQLEQARDTQLRIVVTHQPVHVTRPQDRDELLRGHERAVQRWAAAGADLIIGGHSHLPFVRPLHDHHAALARRVWVVQAGTAVSSRLRHGAVNSVNVVRCLAGPGSTRRCAVERWDYLPRTEAFAQVDRTEMELDQHHGAAH
jgi:3',5'-cyclic AMP phosphodiesterase CpdA